MSDKIEVKVTSAFVLDGGEIAKPGQTVALSKAQAANLLHRGKVELVDAADAPEQAEVLSTETITGKPAKSRKKGKAADGESDGEDGEDA